MCKTKWILVCYHHWSFIHTNWLVFLQIKQLYAAIENYRSQSGFHWDNDCGAGIEGDAAASVWSTYLQQKVLSHLNLHCVVANGLFRIVQCCPKSVPKPWVGTLWQGARNHTLHWCTWSACLPPLTCQRTLSCRWWRREWWSQYGWRGGWQLQIFLCTPPTPHHIHPLVPENANSRHWLKMTSHFQNPP
jgi:hypothetical protein